jgi:RNA polymerase sigma factor (sigma-70 family)
MSALSTSQVTPRCADNELVAAVRRGSDRAFEELYSRYRGRISAYILGIVRDDARADDVAQEVFISALRRLRDTDRPIAFKAWIYEIAKNACIDEFRRTRRAREVPLEPEDDDADGQSRLPSTGPTPDAAVESKQALDDLRGAFHGLSESHHKIIVMREFEGLSYSQIGEQLGMSRPVVESTLFRARRRLGKEYDELVSGRRCEHVQTLIAAGEPKSLLKLGLRERRQLARHLSHCQPCRREARLAGVDDSLFHAPGIAGKIAALLPIPWLRWRRGGGHRSATASTHKHSFALMQPVQSLARFGDLVDRSTVIGRVAAAAAAVALAGLGGGVVVAVAHHESAPPAPRSVPAARSRTAVVVQPPARHTSSARAAAANRSNGAVRSTSASGATGQGAASSASRTGAGQGASSAPAAGASPLGSSSAAGGTAAGHGSAGGHSLLGFIPHSSSGSAVHLPIVQKVTKPLAGVVKKVTNPLGGVVKKVTSAPPIKLQLPQIPQKVSVPGVGTVTVPKVSVPNPSKLLSP